MSSEPMDSDDRTASDTTTTADIEALKVAIAEHLLKSGRSLASGISVEALRIFTFDRVLNDDPSTHSIAILGHLPFPSRTAHTPAIIRLERTAFPPSVVKDLAHAIQDVKLIEWTDAYSWAHAWLKSDDLSDAKINFIFPATDVHIQKYTKQTITMMRETPDLYERIVKPYIASFPPSRTKWVENILNGESEQDKILYKEPDHEYGFVILPDMKWDLKSVSDLYLVAISFNREIRSIRDLRKDHVHMLQRIRRKANRLVKEKWDLEHGSLRYYIHYHPSYYHFHVHIVNANYTGLSSMNVGQAHLLEDVISLLEISPIEGPTILQRMSLTYGLGDQHGLYATMKEAQTLPGIS